MGIITNLLVSAFGPAMAAGLFKSRNGKEGSPVYTWNVGAIAASGSAVIDPNVSFPASRKYAPLDSIIVTNNDTVDLLLTINGKETFYIAAGSIQPVSGELGITHCRITNLDAGTAVTAGKVYATLQKLPKDINDLAREVL